MPVLLNATGITAGSVAHPRPQNLHYSYGTAGFRTVYAALDPPSHAPPPLTLGSALYSADVLDSVLYRVGLLAALRSKNLGGKTIGVMVTASHNPERVRRPSPFSLSLSPRTSTLTSIAATPPQDNGVKLVDPHGEMLTSSWEAYATQLANSPTDDALVQTLAHIVQQTHTDLSIPATVVYGHDTRPSCPTLVRALEDGLTAMDARKLPAGLCTTPQLHYLVRCYNTQGTDEAYGEPTLEGYYKKLAKAYTILAKGRHLLPALTVDCANGVGSPSLKAFSTHLSPDLLPLILTRDDTVTPGNLNLNCGADYVKTQQRGPANVPLVPNQRFASFDGDADRIVYYYADEQGRFHLLDGDKIAGLAAGFIMDLVKDAGLLDVEVGVVQTAYANGASTKYLTDVLGVPVTCVSTGVKHLHHAALAYDIGVYFEANGHGTVLFSPATLARIAAHSHTPTTPSQRAALTNLAALVDVINQTVGDAISDLLLVEAVLLHRQWTSPAQWDAAYSDYPNRLVKVLVRDRHAFTTEDAERRVVSPAGLQDQVDAAVRRVDGGRSFVRPSGTEDCVRVYAEAPTRETADQLAQTVAGIVFDLAGQGPRPAVFA
ncbi:SPOSA6832_03363 [Sporobolomyces salmonicolor]|uniref:Phosphoacetylglucosamine mutase n=1 Tax=Sporidiobolus salmonicolor TaxID=5005 RepID=A0A0D6EP94_SPOSA|nr:SPOSA6832_03363 [Sporobolomyces salmonicolor]